MNDLSTDIDDLKQKYRRIFLKASEEISLKIESLKPEECSNFLTKDIVKEIYEKWVNIIQYKEHFDCAGCAACCKLACSEFSPEELKQKAQNGDNFATQFTSVFVPYEDENEARKVYPEYFELLQEKAQGEKVYYYHCPKVTKYNLCPDYENRPQICKNFPDNPISFLPKTCGYNRWKQKVETTALTLRATSEIVEFYKKKLNP